MGVYLLKKTVEGCTVRNVVQELWLREAAPDLDLLTMLVSLAPEPSSLLQPADFMVIIFPYVFCLAP